MAITFAIFFLSLAIFVQAAAIVIHIAVAIFGQKSGPLAGLADQPEVEDYCAVEEEMSLLDVMRECEFYETFDQAAVMAVDQRTDELVVALLKAEVEDDIFRQMVEQECDEEISAALADTCLAAPQVETAVILCNGQKIDLHISPIGCDLDEMDWDLLSEFVAENLSDQLSVDLSLYDPTSETSLDNLLSN